MIDDTETTSNNNCEQLDNAEKDAVPKTGVSPADESNPEVEGAGCDDPCTQENSVATASASVSEGNLARPSNENSGSRNKFGNRKLYVGNVSNEVTEDGLREFFSDNGLDSDVIVKVILRNGYAFVECRDPEIASVAVEKCNAKTFMNTVLRVEPAERPEFRPRLASRQRSTSQLLVKNCSSETTLKELQTEFSQFGPVSVEEGHFPGSFVVHTTGSKHSDSLLTEFNGKTMLGSRLSLHPISENMLTFDGSGDAFRVSPMSANRSTWKNANGTPVQLMDAAVDFPRGTIPSSVFIAANQYQPLMQTAAEPPLKILVPNEFVGAVIGRGGSTIRAISKGTGARLDIFRNCSRYDVPEKPVTIYGPPEKASKACKKILEIIAQEADHQPDRKGEIALRMFAQDSYIGRVIGKGGNVIKKIMDDTQTKIHVSTQSDYIGKETSGITNRHYVQPVVERLITIRGSIEGMCKAEAVISEKLREAYQNEVRVYETGYPGSGMGSAGLHGTGARPLFPGGGSVGDEEYSRASPNGAGNTRRKFNARTPFTLSSNSVAADISQYIPGGTYSTYPTTTSSAYLNSMAGIWSNEQQQTNLSRPETVNMYIPDDVVGALIGRKGANIRQIIQQTGASVKIMEETLIIDENPTRRVVINGVIDALFKAQYLIYDKVVEEGKGPVNHQIDDIRLTVEMSVPTDMVGRLIGKNGQNIRDIQKNFLCRVKFMTDPDETLPPVNPGETYVRVTGNYNAFLGAQKKIREMLIKAMTRFFYGSATTKPKDGSMSANSSGNSDEMSSATMPMDQDQE
ncbi:unnamed protein product [Orchesella dallaii]|uniref:RRM domain-containing protein n=1 Tax=Orchesella dallaii TaxID=48710 RepID=A0ABP1RNF2_9HEXA